MANNSLHHENQQPDEFDRDLRPNESAGMNYDLEGPHPEKLTRTAYDLKAAHRQLREFPDDDLKRIPILPEGSRLEQGATYINLKEETPQEFTATGGMEATLGTWYVPKSEVDYPL